MPIDLGPEPPLFEDMMKGALVHPAGSGEQVQIAKEMKDRDGITILGFLRHFSCELSRKKALNWSYNLMPRLSPDVSVVVVSNGSVAESTKFVHEFQWPAIDLFTDPDLNTYKALSFAQGLNTVLNSNCTLSAIKSLFKGGIKANHLQLGGVLVIDEKGFVRYFHREAYAGDHADLDELVDAALEARNTYTNGIKKV